MWYFRLRWITFMVLVYFWRPYHAHIWLHNGLWVKVRILSARFMAKPKKITHMGLLYYWSLNRCRWSVFLSHSFLGANGTDWCISRDRSMMQRNRVQEWHGRNLVPLLLFILFIAYLMVPSHYIKPTLGLVSTKLINLSKRLNHKG